MSPTCEQRDATLLWLYGEGDESHAAHVAQCTACQQLADEHLDVLGAIAPVASALTVPAPVAVAEPVPVPANDRRWWFAAAAAAAVVLAVLGRPTAAPVEVDVSPTPVDRLVAAVDPLDDLDLRLDALDAELTDISLDLETL
jgi:hypothetical protein